MGNAVELAAGEQALVPSLHVVPASGAVDVDGPAAAVRALLSALSLRGARAHGSRTVTSSLHGLIRDDPRRRAEFLDLTGIRP